MLMFKNPGMANLGFQKQLTQMVKSNSSKQEIINFRKQFTQKIKSVGGLAAFNLQLDLLEKYFKSYTKRSQTKSNKTNSAAGGMLQSVKQHLQNKTKSQAGAARSISGGGGS